jgi:predicted nucleic acid-binding Zn ribbon protein
MRDDRLRNGEYTLGQALDKMLKTYQLQEKVAISTVRTDWELIVGKTIHKYTKDLYLKGNILYIKVDNPILKQELSYLKSTIIERVNSHMGGQVVKEVVIHHL